MGIQNCHNCGIEIFYREYTSYPICNNCKDDKILILSDKEFTREIDAFMVRMNRCKDCLNPIYTCSSHSNEYHKIKERQQKLNSNRSPIALSSKEKI